MYPKHKIIEWLKINKEFLIDLYELQTWEINFHICDSRSKYVKQLGIKGYKGNCCGISMTSSKTKSSDIIIFYDKSRGRQDAIGTIFHELLHVKMAKLIDCVTIKVDCANVEEENIVQSLERLMLKLYKDKR